MWTALMPSCLWICFCILLILCRARIASYYDHWYAHFLTRRKPCRPDRFHDSFVDSLFLIASMSPLILTDGQLCSAKTSRYSQVNVVALHDFLSTWLECSSRFLTPFIPVALAIPTGELCSLCFPLSTRSVSLC